ncbi:MAG: universal stress protein [Gammaproteobacteria bacterium]
MKTLDTLLVLDDSSPASARAREYAERFAAQTGAACEVRTKVADLGAIGTHLLVVPSGSPDARAIVERTATAVMLTPAALPAPRPLWRAVVPLTGQPGGDAALEFTVRLAGALSMQVIAVHVADPNADSGTGLEAAAHYADAAHHEYPQQLKEFVQRALPQCSVAERAALTDLVLCRGDVIAELLTLVRERDADLLVVTWQGRLARKGSRLLERLAGALRCPLVIVKPVSHGPFRLKVGEDLE